MKALLLKPIRIMVRTVNLGYTLSNNDKNIIYSQSNNHCKGMVNNEVKHRMKSIQQSIQLIIPHIYLKTGVKFIKYVQELLFHSAHKIYCTFSGENEEEVFLIAIDSSKEQINEIKSRWSFYCPHLSIGVLEINNKKTIPWKIILSKKPLLIIGKNKLNSLWIKCRPGIFDVDYFCNHMDGWEWHKLINYMSRRKTNYLDKSKIRFKKRIDELKKEQLKKCYIYGTGPSLEKAMNRDWTDGYRVVCNTIVRDKVLWEHLNPHFIVAGDAIYHFGHTLFAKAFRKDLAERLNNSKTFFVYPDMFHEFVLREFSCFSDQLIPIPLGYHKKINIDLSCKFNLPNLGNVLALLLLPLGCTLSKNIYMFGFDGRAPDDKLFWSNSTKHSYPEFMHELQKSHPRFFAHFVPISNPTKYITDIQGDFLDECMATAENEGWHFYMMHKSWTPTLQKRCGK